MLYLLQWEGSTVAGTTDICKDVSHLLPPTTTSLDCAFFSNSRLVSGYWPTWAIFSAMQISSASKSATLCLLDCLMLT